MQDWFYVQSAEYGKYYIEVDVNDYGTYNIWIGMLYSDGSVGNPANKLTTSNKSSARRKYNKFIQDAETDFYGWNSHIDNPIWKFDTNTSLNSVQEYILSNPKNIKASSYRRNGSNMKKYVKASTSEINMLEQIQHTVNAYLITNYEVLSARENQNLVNQLDWLSNKTGIDVNLPNKLDLDYDYSDTITSASSGIRMMTQKQIKDYVRDGAATDITNYGFSEMKDFLHSHDLDKIAVSRGTYGINGGLLQDRDTGEMYAITARNSALMMAF